MTNKEWLSALSDERFYDEWIRAIENVGRWDIETRCAMIEWLGREHKTLDARCNMCEHYDGVHRVQGCAPCLKHNRMVLYNECCPEFNLTTDR